MTTKWYGCSCSEHERCCWNFKEELSELKAWNNVWSTISFCGIFEKEFDCCFWETAYMLSSQGNDDKMDMSVHVVNVKSAAGILKKSCRSWREETMLDRLYHFVEFLKRNLIVAFGRLLMSESQSRWRQNDMGVHVVNMKGAAGTLKKSCRSWRHETMYDRLYHFVEFLKRNLIVAFERLLICWVHKEMTTKWTWVFM